MFVIHGKMAIKSLRSNKVRTFLTLLGIIIGVTSVTTIIGLGEGIKHQVNQQINDLGSDLVTVIPGRTTQKSGFSEFTNLLESSQSSTTAQLSQTDLTTISHLSNVKGVSGSMQLDGSVTHAAKKHAAQILGVSENYLSITNHKLLSGQYFGGSLENNQTTVLSSNMAKQLFGNQDPLGSTVTIRGTDFIVIGVLDDSKGFNFGQQLTNSVLIPLPSAASLNQNVTQLQEISLKLNDPSKVTSTIGSVAQALTKNHGGEEDFTVTTQQQLADTSSSIFKVLTSFTAAVASISLLVGGIGVMNIMLVTVTERTREIGIRKAIGATRNQILMQFLIEALVITSAGGVIGIIISLIIESLVRSQTSIRPAMDPWIVLLAAAVSLVVGIIFGTWPAIRAARKDPIEALHYD